MKRENEQSNINHRDLMEACPDNTDTTQWKIFRQKYNDAAKLIINEAPAQIDIELNSNCNLKCSFCIQSVMKIPVITVPLDKFKTIIDECKTLGITSLKLNYQNEPLIKKDIFDYIRYAKENGFINIFFSTNGILLTEITAERLIEAGITKIFISLDAFKPETYLKLRGKDELENIKNNILNFIKIRNAKGLTFPVVRVNFLKNTENISELEDFLFFWTDKVDLINVQDMNDLIDSETNLYIKDQKELNYKCSMPFKQVVINAFGDLLPCCTMHGIRHKIGNINSMTIAEAWESDKMKYLRELHSLGNIKNDPICKACIYGK